MRLPLGIRLLHCVEVTSQSEKGKISCSKEGGVLPIGRLLFLSLPCFSYLSAPGPSRVGGIKPAITISNGVRH